MAEWSKAMDSSPITEKCVGSSPTGTIFSLLKTNHKNSVTFSIIIIHSLKGR